MAYDHSLAKPCYFRPTTIHKGSLLYIEGKLNYRQFESKDGQKVFVTEIVADHIILLDKKDKIQLNEIITESTD